MLQTSPAGKLDPRVKRTRQLIQSAFKDLLHEADFQNITVQDIATRAGVNRATFYAHFEDKYALLNYTVREMLNALLEQKLSDIHTFSVANLQALIEVVSEFMAQFYGHCCIPALNGTNQHLLMASQVQVHLYELFLLWFKPMQPDKAEQVAAALSWTIFGSAMQAARGTRKLAPGQVAEQVLAFIQPSLAHILGEVVSR